MQLVLSNNRVINYGENFIAMGGTVINTETGIVYQNATVAECSNCPSDIGTVGYEYHAGRFVPCAPFGRGKGNVAVYCDDCKTPRDSGVHFDDVCQMSSYFAFVGNINADMVAAAFGKNNENFIKNIGKQLAMYGWYKGDDSSYTNLQKMWTINDMNTDIYNEIIRSDNLSELILANEYARSKFFEEYTLEGDVPSSMAGESVVITKDIVITAEDLLYPFRYSYSIDGIRTYEIRMHLNDVEVVMHDSDFDSDGNYNALANWSAYGITSPGTYTMKLSMFTQVGVATVDCSFNVYKMKQSYSV